MALSITVASLHCEYLEILTYNTGDQYYNRYWINTSHAAESQEYQIVDRTKFGGATGYEGGNSCFVFPLILENKTYNPLGNVDDTCMSKAFVTISMSITM